jgi:hypothetical protein
VEPVPSTGGGARVLAGLPQRNEPSLEVRARAADREWQESRAAPDEVARRTRPGKVLNCASDRFSADKTAAISLRFAALFLMPNRSLRFDVTDHKKIQTVFRQGPTAGAAPSAAASAPSADPARDPSRPHRPSQRSNRRRWCGQRASLWHPHSGYSASSPSSDAPNRRAALRRRRFDLRRPFGLLRAASRSVQERSSRCNEFPTSLGRAKIPGRPAAYMGRDGRAPLPCIDPTLLSVSPTPIRTASRVPSAGGAVPRAERPSNTAPRGIRHPGDAESYGGPVNVSFFQRVAAPF